MVLDSIDMKKKRVAVLGTGSSAIQIIPEVQKSEHFPVAINHSLIIANMRS